MMPDDRSDELNLELTPTPEETPAPEAAAEAEPFLTIKESGVEIPVRTREDAATQIQQGRNLQRTHQQTVAQLREVEKQLQMERQAREQEQDALRYYRALIDQGMGNKEAAEAAVEAYGEPQAQPWKPELRRLEETHRSELQRLQQQIEAESISRAWQEFCAETPDLKEEERQALVAEMDQTLRTRGPEYFKKQAMLHYRARRAAALEEAAKKRKADVAQEVLAAQAGQRQRASQEAGLPPTGAAGPIPRANPTPPDTTNESELREWMRQQFSEIRGEAP